MRNEIEKLLNSISKKEKALNYDRHVSYLLEEVSRLELIENESKSKESDLAKLQRLERLENALASAGYFTSMGATG